MKRNAWYVLGGLAGAILLVVLWPYFPVELWSLLGAVVAMGGVAKYMATSETVASRATGLTTGTTIQDDLEQIQTFLNQQNGHYKFDLFEHKDSVNEDTIRKELAGEMKEFYAVVGRRQNPADEYPRTQLFVWNKTDNRKHAYYRDVVQDELKHDPLYRHYPRRFLKAEGRAAPDTDEGQPQWTGVNMEVTNSPPRDEDGGGN